MLSRRYRRWRWILPLLAVAFLVGAANHYLSRFDGPRVSLDPGGMPGPAMVLDSPAAGNEIPRLLEEMGRPVAVVSGQVIDPEGKPIPGAEARLGERDAVTDPHGEFILPQKPADLELRHPDYFPRVLGAAMRRGLSLPGETRGEGARERLIIVLFPGGRVAGKVVDEEGRPLAGARVAFDGEEPPSTASDGAGEFRGPILRPGIHHLSFHHPEHQRTDAQVLVPFGGGEARFTAVLHPGAPLEVRTVDAAGDPVHDAGVWLERKPGAGAEESLFVGRTGDDGRLLLRFRAQDPHSVRVLAPGFRESVEEVNGDRVVVALERAPLLSGLVIERERGLPVMPREISLEVETTQGFQRAPDRGILFRTLSTGKYRLGLPPFPGTYRVRANAGGDLGGVSEPVAFDGVSDLEGVTIYLVERTGLRGQVVAPSRSGALEPVAGARVEVYRHDQNEAPSLAHGLAHGASLGAPPAPVRTGTTDASGSFSFSDLNQAAYRVRVLDPGRAEWVSAPVSVPLEAPLPCALRKGVRLRGSVRGPHGAPRGGVTLVLFSPAHPFTRFTRSDEAGSYEIRDLAPGPYVLTLGSEPGGEGEASSQTVLIAPGEDLILDLET